ncbi:zinc finger protein 345-like isoform X3 [Bacillus rossius redtenbacheri]|uniref:zinc finger protein 345-like isoform X3 n=1 Tax=Bacillus rossius redtenbacheri TaxID=93214 RepID=UPI002FDD0191
MNDRSDALQKICRLCLSETGVILPIFESFVSAEDKLPTFICHRCLYEVDRFHEFKEMCGKANMTLTHCFQKQASEVEKVVAFKQELLDETVYYDADDPLSDESERQQNSSPESSDCEQPNQKSCEKLPLDTEKSVNVLEIVKCYSPLEDCVSVEEARFPSLQKKFELVEMPQLDPQGACDNSDPELEVETTVDSKMDGVLQTALDDTDKNQLKTKFSCKYCPRKFVYRLSLLKHEGAHRNEKLSFSCKMCSRLFSSHIKFEAHKKAHERKTTSKTRREIHDHRKLIVGDYSCRYCRKEFNHTEGECFRDTGCCSTNPNKTQQCRFCSKSFLHRGSGWRHEKFTCEMNPKRSKKTKSNEDMPSELFACRFCGKSFAHRGSCWRHEKSHSGIKPYVCKHCPKSFGEKAHFDRHVRMHLGVKPFHCKLCHKAFADMSNLRNHERTHDGAKPHLCSICGKSYAVRAMLLRHELVHGGARPHECATCRRTYACLADLRKHQKLHVKEPGFLCSECGKSFSQNWQLKSHSIIHTGLKPFKCEVCEKSFNNYSNFRAHQRIHKAGPRPFLCSHCALGFFTKSQLAMHLRVHTGERPHPCRHCPKSFRVRSRLLAHEEGHLRTRNTQATVPADRRPN